MPDNDSTQERAAAAIREADSGSNHQAGTDGDDQSVADRDAQTETESDTSAR